MSDKKLITVVGATGAQGGSTARALLRDPSFAVRAVTRDPDSDAARALAEAGAEVVKADIDDEASLVAALDGAYGAFFVTFFWAHFSPAVEQAQAQRMAQAAKAAGIQHAIWSTLEDTRRFIPLEDDRMPTLMGEYKVPHFDAKGSANHFFTDAGVPTTFLQTAFYWDNMIGFGSGPQRGEDGSLVLVFPMGDAPLSGIAAEDIGKVAAGIFAAGDTYIGQTVSIAGEHLTVEQMAAQLSDAIGRAGDLRRGRAGRLPRPRVPRRGGPGEHVPVLPGLQRLLRRRTRPDPGPAAQPRAHVVSVTGSPPTPTRSPSHRPRTGSPHPPTPSGPSRLDHADNGSARSSHRGSPRPETSTRTRPMSRYVRLTVHRSSA
jgi:uncharacterized protein YbjT (DUF2867 family)